ncbi:helix-turn-helix domain-containing protein [Ruegeria sp. 2205SS24-7]|uniref:helix-turn-helix domain-containing protein n=1 Tax=Ruegeria discodermiae TaxID=3064389 RepID=UPI0027407A23|nr:helix-turn-helix domain-containing protein [Ruegeria sp. 2205SS24-7]MDP5220168.1 helix-turn-helix domain-containing protein [Ruegeria sp. 2205SS24-7]
MKEIDMNLAFGFSIRRVGDKDMFKFPSFPEIVVAVDKDEMSEADIIARAERLVKHALQVRLDYNRDIPSGDCSKAKDIEYCVRMSPLVTTKVLLYLECRKNGWSKAQIARHLDVTPTTAARILDLFHESRTEVLAYAASRMGKALDATISLVPAVEHAEK